MPKRPLWLSSGQRASFNRDNPSSNPTEVNFFSVKYYLKALKIREKIGIGHFKNTLAKKSLYR